MRVFPSALIAAVVLLSSAGCIKPKCSEKNCDGCCADDVCQPGTLATACGLHGAACATCGAGQSCDAAQGTCKPGSGTTCSPANCAGCCANSACYLGLDGNACGKNGAACDMCDSNEECVQGTACLPKCNGCMEAGVCQVGLSDAACGANGAACVACPAGQECANGSCKAVGSCKSATQACANTSDCCNGLACEGGACAPVTCSGQSCSAGLPQGGCCSSAPYCSGPSGLAASKSCNPNCALDGRACAASSDCCGGFTCQGGACVSAVCAGSGCTAGFSQGGCCAEAKHCVAQTAAGNKVCSPACGSEGMACVGNGDCCAGFECNEGVCGAPTNCSSETCNAGFAQGGCCAAAQYCAGDSAPGKACSTACAAAGKFCAGNADCCQGLLCMNGSCSPATNCLGKGCTFGQPNGCCGEAPYCTAETGARTCGEFCGMSGMGCGGNADCCSGLVCNNNVCGPVPTCNGNACSKSYGLGGCCLAAPFCTGTLSPTCSQTCGTEQARCSDDNSCCSGLVCKNNVCTVETVTCGGRACSGADGCCGAQPYCNGSTPSKGCSASCGTSNMYCGSSADCCSGLSCQSGQCTASTGCAGTPCSSADTCCGAQPYCNGSTPSKGCSASCGTSNMYCGSGADCCSGLSCVDGKCQSGGTCSFQGCSGGIEYGGCCASSPYCISTSPGSWYCSDSCGQTSMACISSDDCCSSLRCLEYMCGSASCASAGATCTSTKDCCSGFCVANQTAEMMTCSASCTSTGSFCRMHKSCCTGYCDMIHNTCAPLP